MSTYVKINDIFISKRIAFKPEDVFSLDEDKALSLVDSTSAISWIISNIDFYYKKLREMNIHQLSSIKIVTESEKDVTDFVLKRRFINEYAQKYGLRTKPLFNDLINKNIEYSSIITCKKRKLEHSDLVDLRNLLKDYIGSTRDFKIVSASYDLAIGLKNENDSSTIRLAMDADYSCKIFSPPTLEEFKEEYEDFKDPLRNKKGS